MLRVGTIKSFVDVITTVGRLPTSKKTKSELKPPAVYLCWVPHRQGEGALHALSCCHGEWQQGSAEHHLHGHVVHPAGQAGEGQEQSAAEGVHRGRDSPQEPYQVRAPPVGHVVWCSVGEQV